MAKTKRNVFLSEKLPGLAPSAAPIAESVSFEAQKLSFATFQQISQEYRERHGHQLVYCDNQGNLIYGLPGCRDFPCQLACSEFRRRALEKALEEGRPVSSRCDGKASLWGVPVMINNIVNGGLVVAGGQGSVGDPELDGLLALAAKYNIVNLAFLQNRANKQFKRQAPASPVSAEALQRALFKDETELIACLRKGDAAQARQTLLKVAALVVDLPEEGLELGKGLVLDLVMSIDHAAAEEGSDFSRLMQQNCSISHAVDKARSLPELAEILLQCLENATALAGPYHKRTNDVVLRNILSYLEQNFTQSLSREEVATRFNTSVSHLSHLLREKTGQTFVEILNRYRVDRAAQLLAGSENTLVSIALDCGFQDQSYFGKVFRAYYGCSPARFRRERANG